MGVCTQDSYLNRGKFINMTRGDEDMKGGGSENFLDTLKGVLKKLGGTPKICILQNQQERGGS